MSYAQFQEHWEHAAAAELSVYQQRPARELLDDISKGKYGTHYQIWYALQNRTTFEEAGTLLLRVLRSNEEDLIRYHCAALLLSLRNPFPDVLTAAKLSGRKKYYVEQHLNEYEQATRT